MCLEIIMKKDSYITTIEKVVIIYFRESKKGKRK